MMRNHESPWQQVPESVLHGEKKGQSVPGEYRWKGQTAIALVQCESLWDLPKIMLTVYYLYTVNFNRN